ncbi:MAG: hypothetical protein KGL52_10420 [Rhodospirillales bacterium]|jgi:hypothetical protein|nr:hypothetical protein [Rhodospirillales bacterium]
MADAPPHPSVARFALVIEGLCNAIAACDGRGLLARPLTALVWWRLRRLVIRFAAVAARVAGPGGRGASAAVRRKPEVPPDATQSAAPDAAADVAPDATPDTTLAAAQAAPHEPPRDAAPVAPHRPARPLRLPRSFGWLLRLGFEVRGSGSQLAALLNDPEMAALLAANPSLARMLRPLCRMLGLVLPGDPPARPRRPRPPRPPRPPRRRKWRPSRRADLLLMLRMGTPLVRA